MKSSAPKFAMLVLTVMAFLTNCTTSSEKVADAEQNVIEAQNDLDNANNEYLKDIETFKSETKSRIDANQKSIDEFHARIAKEKKEVKAEYQKNIAELENKNSDMKKQLDDYQADGKENWEAFKTKFNQDMEELGVAFTNFFKK